MEKYIYLIAPTVAWIVAQAVKPVIAAAKHRQQRINMSEAFEAGGMPSGHASGSVALLTVIGIEQGIYSSIFGLAFVLTVLICYDAIGVRRSTGDNIRDIQKLAKKAGVKVSVPRSTGNGHTPAEMLGGVLNGLIIGIILTNLL